MMETGPEEEVVVTPEELLLDKTNYWTSGHMKTLRMGYLESSTEEVIQTALLLNSYNMLSRSNIESLVCLLENLTSPEVQSHTIIDKILDRALSGTEADCHTMLKILLPLIDKKAFNAQATSQIFNAIRSCLIVQIPTQKELEEGARKIPGVVKLYYLRDNLSRLEISVRRLQRAGFMAGVLFLQKMGGLAESGHNATQQLIEAMMGSTTTLQSFHAVCSILIAIFEQRFTWGYVTVPEIDTALMRQIETEFGDFLTFRERQSDDGQETKDFLVDIYARAFRILHPESEDWNPRRGAWDAFEPPRPEADLLILERHYSRIYKFCSAVNRRVFSGPTAPKFFPGKLWPKEVDGGWQSDIEDIAFLFQYGLRDRLTAENLRQYNAREQEEIDAGMPPTIQPATSKWFTSTWLQKVRSQAAALLAARRNPQMGSGDATGGRVTWQVGSDDEW